MADVVTIPVWSNSKKPAHRAWQIKAPIEQRTEAGSGFLGNVVVRVGNDVAVLDAGSPEMVTSLEAFLAGLGLKLPRVITARGTGVYRHWMEQRRR